MSISIYQDGIYALSSQLYSQDSEVIVFNRTSRNLAIAFPMFKFFLSVAFKASKELIACNLSSFDPIVGENTCQVRALEAIDSYLNHELREEAERVNGIAKTGLQHLNYLSTHLPKLGLDQSFEKIIEICHLELNVSSKLSYCFRSFLLTHGKFFGMTRDLVETSGISSGTLKDRLSKSMVINHIDRIVNIAKRKIAEDTIAIIQRHARRLPETVSRHLEDRYIRRGKFQTSCAFFNFKTVLMTLQAMQIPILVKEHKGSSFKLLYRSIEPNGPLIFTTEAIDKSSPVFVIEAFSCLWRSTCSSN